MAKTGFAARMGAAAFLAGVALAVPQSTAVATADRADKADTGSASDTASSDTASSETSSASTDASGAGDIRVGRGTRPAARGGTDRTSSDRTPAVSPPRAAAAGRSPGEARRTAAGPSAADVQPPATTVTDPAPRSTSPEPVVAPVVPAREIPVPSPAVTAPAQIAAATAAAPTPAGVATLTTPVQPAQPSHPGALAAMTASAGASANASSASLIDTLLAPIRSIFGEGTALLVRRSLFNQAPTTAPVQLTGQSEGPITGTVGAVDLEGDPLSYAVTGTPLHGSAVVNADGSYTYTPGTNFTGTDSFVVEVTDTGFHINLLDVFRPAGTSASVAVAQGALAAMLRFQFVYGSGSQYWSSAARAALESAANELASSIVVNSPVTITYDVTGANSPFSSTLASAGSDFVNNDSGFLQTVVQNKILSGADANGSAADGTIDWNFGPSWAFGSPSNNAYDFESIAMHELLHTFGFLSNIDKAGSNTGQVWTVFDGYVVNSAGTRVINSGSYTWNAAYNANLTGGNGGLYFGGPNAVAAYQALVPLYAPNPWEPGSSLSHLDDNRFSGPNEKLMNAESGVGPGIRVISPIELGILTDIGYTVRSGSGTPTLLFVGFIALRMRRRRD
jgi:hypothetical protein